MTSPVKNAARKLERLVGKNIEIVPSQTRSPSDSGGPGRLIPDREIRR